VTAAASSADTTAGVAPDDAAGVAGKIRTALGLDADVSGFFTIGGTGANVALTAKAEAANGATMNIAIDNDTCAGLTAARKKDAK
jgi:glutamate/tyrosine decarboxylase-like PLP-dependent enzyme